MATFSKKLYMKNSDGDTESAEIYSTTGESGTPYLPVIVDSTNGYIALCSTSDSGATSGRVKLSGGSTYAIGSSGVPDYDYQLFTSSGSFTVPTGVSTMRVTCVGGGAGGSTGSCCKAASSGIKSTTTQYTTKTGTTSEGGTYTYTVEETVVTYYSSGATIEDWYGLAGGTSSFGSLASASGGSKCHFQCTGTGTATATITYTLSKGYNNGTYGGSCTSDGYSGGSSVPIYTIDGTKVTTAGAGGYADGNGHTVLSGASGYRTITTVSVTPGTTYTVTVGSGSKTNWEGSGRDDWNSNGHGGAAGDSGAVLVEWGQGIS